MKHLSDPNLDRDTVSAANIEIGNGFSTAPDTERIASRIRAFFITYRSYLILLLLQGLIIWMFYNWVEIIHRMVHYYIPLPIWDYWRVVEDFPQLKALHLQFLWRQHNEHRIVFPEIVFLMDMLLWHGRQFLPLAASFLFHLSAWFAVGWTVASDHLLSRSMRVIIVLLSGVIIGWQGSVSLLAWPFLLQWTLTGAAAIFSLIWLSLAGAQINRSTFWLALSISSAIVANYSSANGLLLWPVLIAAGFLLSLPKRQLITLVACSAISIGAYFVGYRFGGSLNLAAFFFHPLYTVGFIASYLSMPFGAIGASRFLQVGVLAGLASMGAAALLFVYAMRMKLLKTRPSIVFFGFYAFVLLTAIMTAAGRMNLSDPTFLAAKPPRYVTLPLVNWAVLLALCLWLAARGKRKALAATLVLGFVCLIGAGFSKLEGWVTGSETEFANAQEAALSVEDGLATPRLMQRIYPDREFLERMLPILREHHLSIYYRSRDRWLGKPASEVGKLLGGFTPGAIVQVLPVSSGVEVLGWAYDGGNEGHGQWIVLVNEVGRVVGFGERFPAGIPNDPILRNPENLRLPIWIGFANPSVKSAAYRAYLITAAGLSPLGSSVPVPPFLVASPNQQGVPISGIQWEINVNGGGNAIPNIPRQNSPHRHVYSTWNGSDANTGEITSSAFDAPLDGCVILPVLHGPSVDGLAVNVWDAQSNRLMGTLQMLEGDQEWHYWRLHLSANIKRLFVSASDQGRGWGQWVAIGQPSRCKAN